MNITNGCIADNAQATLFQYYVQLALPIPSTKVQVSPKTANTILMTYQLTGGLYTGVA